MNYRLLKSSILMITIILFSSCSSDENSDNEQSELKNEMIFNGTNYALATAWINDENITTDDPSDIGFNLSNKTNNDLINGNNLTNVTTIYFDFNEVNLQETTYTEILDYDIAINRTLTNGNYTSGTLLLSDDDENTDIYASSSSVTINNLTENSVDLTFTFTRKDGQLIQGAYSGNYIVPITTD